MMPPKSKSKKADKGKPSTAAAGPSAEEDKFKDQLMEQIVLLREELDRVREEKRCFRMEKDKIQASWEISLKKLEEAKAELRNKLRKRDEARQRHQEEIREYKQRLKQTLAEHHNTISEMKTDSVTSTSQIQDQHAETELSLLNEKHNLQADFRELNLCRDAYLKELQLKHQMDLKELDNHYEKKIRENEEMYREKMCSAIEAATSTVAEDSELEEDMQSLLLTVRKENNRAIKAAEREYTSIMDKQYDEEMSLRKKVAEEEEKEKQDKRRLAAAKKENERLKKALQETKEKVTKRRKQLEEKRAAMEPYGVTRARKKALEKKVRDMKMKNVALELAYEKAKKEKEEREKEEMEAIRAIERKSGLETLVFERKMALLKETTEKTEAKLCAAQTLSSDEAVRNNATKKLEELFASKEATLNALKEDVAQARKEYEENLQEYKQRPRVPRDRQTLPSAFHLRFGKK